MIKPIGKETIDFICVRLQSEHSIRYGKRKLKGGVEVPKYVSYKIPDLYIDLQEIMRSLHIPRKTIEKALVDLKADHLKRYGEKMRKDGKGYEPKRKSYLMEHLLNDDLEFTLRHIGCNT